MNLAKMVSSLETTEWPWDDCQQGFLNTVSQGHVLSSDSEMSDSLTFLPTLLLFLLMIAKSNLKQPHQWQEQELWFLGTSVDDRGIADLVKHWFLGSAPSDECFPNMSPKSLGQGNMQ